MGRELSRYFLIFRKLTANHTPDRLVKPNVRKKEMKIGLGLWAGSGSVYLENGSMLRSKFDSGSIELITKIEQILNDNGLSKRSIYKNSHSKKPSYAIRYNTDNDQYKLYQYFYIRHFKDSIEQRQYEQFKSYFSLKSKTVNESVNK